MTNDKEIITQLLADGLKVEVINPNGANFNERYHVYQDVGAAGKKTVVINKDGRVIGKQG